MNPIIGGILAGAFLSMLGDGEITFGKVLKACLITLLSLGLIVGGSTVYEMYQDRQYKLTHPLTVQGKVVTCRESRGIWNILKTYTYLEVEDPWTSYSKDKDGWGIQRIQISVNGSEPSHSYFPIKVKGRHEVTVGETYTITYNQITQQLVSLKQVPKQTTEETANATITWELSGGSGP